LLIHNSLRVLCPRMVKYGKCKRNTAKKKKQLAVVNLK